MPFQEYYDRLTNELKKNDEYYSTLCRFAFLSDKPLVEKLSFLSKLRAVKRIMVAHKKNHKKSQKESHAALVNGNDAFDDKDFNTALRFYNQSIRYAVAGTKELGLAFGNRSAILFRQGKYMMCISDIDRALSNKYPKELCYRLLERKTECGVKLGFINETEDYANKDDCNNETDLKNGSKNDAKIVSGSNFLDKISNEVKKPRLPTVTGSESKTFPCTTDAFNVILQEQNEIDGMEKFHKNINCEDDYSEGDVTMRKIGNEIDIVEMLNSQRGFRNKCRAFAEQDIETGDVILVEQPYVSYLDGRHNETNCHHCCKNISYGLPCTECSGVMFCSDGCRDDAWTQYHQVECEYLRFLEDLRMPKAIMALRIVLKTGLRNILAYNKKKKNIKHEKEQNDSGVYVHDENHSEIHSVYKSHDYHTVFNLVNHEKDRPCIELFRLCLLSLMLTNLLELTNFFGSRGDSELSHCRNIVASHLCQHLLSVSINSSSIYDYMSLFKPSPKATNFNAFGLYTTLSLINNSCDPNTMMFSYNNTCVLRAIKPIKPGEEITTARYQTYQFASKTKRQQTLQEVYHITCKCWACEKEWPILHDRPWQNLRALTPRFLCPCLTPLDYTSHEINNVTIRETNRHPSTCFSCPGLTPLDYTSSEKNHITTREINRHPATCPQCDVLYDTSKLVAATLKCHENFNLYTATTEDTVAILEDLKNELSYMHSYILQPSVYYVLCQAMIVIIYTRMASDYSQ